MLFLAALLALALVPTAHPAPESPSSPAQDPSEPALCSQDLSRLDPTQCPSAALCDSHDLTCVTCTCPERCAYGQPADATCTVHPDVPCLGNRTFTRPFKCQYCFQSNFSSDYACEENFECDSVAPPGDRLYKANCTVRADLLCLGQRTFPRMVECSWTRGHVWTTTLLLSIGCGGFGFDR